MKNSTQVFDITLPPSIVLSEPWPQTANRYREVVNGAAENLPEAAQLRDLLGLEEVGAVGHILESALLKPIAEFTSRRGKRVRGHLVALACRLLSHEVPSRNCELAAEAVELIHAASLIVDDIEDGSPVRRGQ